MTAQEQQLIDELVDRIRNTSVQDKDTEAEQHLKQGLANSPDALYILAQTVIVQKYGLEQAQAKLQALQAELDSLRDQAAQAQNAPKSSGGSFLSHIFGGGSQPDQQPPSPPSQGGWQSVTNPQPGYSQPAYPQPGYGQPGYGQPGYAPAPMPYPQPGYGQPSGWGASPMGGGGGFLRGAMQTAAGVAMGEMAMESIESLFHGFGGGGGYGRGFEGGRPSETVINNYDYGDSRDRDEGSHDRDRDDSSFYNPHDDASRENSTQNFAGNDQDDNRDDGQSVDDDNYDSGDDSNDFSDDSSSGSDDSNY